MVVATGFFDGVHLGHRLVIEELVKASRQRDEESMVVTFWPHPRNVLQQEARNLRLLSTLEEKKSMLLSLGVDRVEVLDFTKSFSTLTARDYLVRYLMGKFRATAIVLGYDNKVGSDAVKSDDVSRIAGQLGLTVIRTGAYPGRDGVAISSTKIRRRIADGDVDIAASMLGYEYSLLGVVVAGNRLGRTLGFPTANMQLYEPLKMIPGKGVYFVKVGVLGAEYWGMCDVGNKPTVGNGSQISIETNIFDFDEDIYGLDIKVTFIRNIRDEVRFDSLDLLKEQLIKDRILCEKYINQ